jgi:Ca-activated chloride channel family protein
VLLLTDGLANVGLADPTAIAGHVAELRSRGVLTSTFGVGAGFNQLLLEGMADAGGGNFYFMESAAQLEDLLTSEVGEALQAVARDVRVVVEHAGGMRVRLLDAFAHEPHRDGAVTRLGMLTAEQVIELVYEVEVAGAAPGAVSGLHFVVRDADGALGRLAGAVEFRHADSVEVEAEPVDADVVRGAARRIRLLASEQAYALSYQGRQGEVRHQARAAVEQLQRLAVKVPAARGLFEDLEHDLAQAEVAMEANHLKSAYYVASRLRRGRDVTGKAITDPR